MNFSVRLTLEEAKGVAEKLDLTLDEFRRDYTEPAWPGVESLLVVHRNGACVFLERSNDGKMNFCIIHSFKPDCCRDWRAGISQRECQEGLEKLWGLRFSRSGEVEGPKEKVSEFREFMASIKD